MSTKGPNDAEGFSVIEFGTGAGGKGVVIGDGACVDEGIDVGIVADDGAGAEEGVDIGVVADDGIGEAVAVGEDEGVSSGYKQWVEEVSDIGPGVDANSDVTALVKAELIACSYK